MRTKGVKAIGYGPFKLKGAAKFCAVFAVVFTLFHLLSRVVFAIPFDGSLGGTVLQFYLESVNAYFSACLFTEHFVQPGDKVEEVFVCYKADDNEMTKDVWHE